MSNELALALSNEVECNERYQAPSALTVAGARDRRHERDHAVSIRDADRQGREAVAESALSAVKDIAWMEGRARVKSEAKFLIQRAARESEIIAGDDPVIAAKCAILDDESFGQMRQLVNRPNPGPARLF